MYFDNAATTFPKPEIVYQEMDRFLRTAGANPGRSGHRLAVEAARYVARARQRLARLLNAESPERVVFTGNCTEALNLALKGLLRPGDHVITTQWEHNASARPLRRLEASGVRLTRVPPASAAPGDELNLQALREAFCPETRLVAMVHASNVTGAVLPVAEVGAECRKRGVPLLIDAAQSAGSLPLDVQEMGADLLALPGHKGLFGPPGTGALYIGPGPGPGIVLNPLVEGGTGSVSEQDRQPDALPDRFESGTLNSVGIAGLGAALGWWEETGRERIHQRQMELVRVLWEGLATIPGVRLFGPPPGEQRASVLSFTLAGWEPTDVELVLDESFQIQCRAGLHCAPWAHQSLGTFPTGTIRLSPEFFNTVQECEAAVRAVWTIAGG